MLSWGQAKDTVLKEELAEMEARMAPLTFSAISVQSLLD